MKNISTLIVKGSVLVLMFVLLASCKNQQYIQRGDTLPTAFKKSMKLFQAEKYSEAASAFETVIQIGRGTDYGKKAQFMLAESYNEDERYLLAASEYERYISLFPRSEDRQIAQFKEAYCYYKLSPRYKLDQSYTRKAIEKFRLYNSRYQNSEKRQEAAQYITEMRAKLAKKHFYAADLYMRIDDYEAAITYYDLTIDQYPESIWAQRALVEKIKTYNIYAGRSIISKQKERYQKAVSAYETFIQLFPNGKYRSQADEHVDVARAALAELTVESDEKNSTARNDDSGSSY
ncbi:outer membrane protein assembly factor BamD [Fodinibius halophilus]|uniref:Outer membrane protein assembly factor BamD n=1 Tax=Fodinibius halophilus TaxID=1736908 RepID=A0A6M1T4X2_9BACT|nr:outer membrane protein assembly factor BamD [Fodinibius halophilus]NGP89087.1 outer membrane protein assembly factor BamD [Fodinibius halophilus]